MLKTKEPVTIGCQCGMNGCQEVVKIPYVTLVRVKGKGEKICSSACCSLTDASDMAGSGLIMERHRGRYGKYVTVQGDIIGGWDTDF